MTTRHSVTIADDHPVVLGGLVSLISADTSLEVLASATTGRQALEDIRQQRPDVAVIDYRMPDINALGILKELRKDGLPTRVIVLAGLMSDAEIYAAFDLGAAGILFKDTAVDTLRECVREVATTGQWHHPEPVASAIDRGRSNARAWHDKAQSLTSREIELVELARLGRTNKEIAAALDLSEGTVKVHFHNIFRKFGVGTRQDLLAIVTNVDPV